MNFAYLADGTVVGYNRKATEGTEELTGVCTPQNWKVLPQEYNSNVDCYTAAGGALEPKSITDVDGIIAEDEYKDSLAAKIGELKDELDFKADSAVPKSNSKSDLKIVSRQLKLLSKKVDGRASAAEVAELEASEVIDDHLDALTDTYDEAESWLELAERTIEEINDYDVTTDPNWPLEV